jgi:hypothetical protein
MLCCLHIYEQISTAAMPACLPVQQATPQAVQQGRVRKGAAATSQELVNNKKRIEVLREENRGVKRKRIEELRRGGVKRRS